MIQEGPNIIRISRIICDFIILVVCAVPLLIFHEFVTPYKRGFYCDDETIRYPVVQSTVPRELLVVVGIIIPACLIIGTEIFRAQAWERKCNDQFKTYHLKNYNVHRLIVRLYCFIGYFFLGICFNQLMVDIAKYTIGRHRPHFMDACRPNKGYSSCINPDEYILDWTCTNNNTKVTHEAQLSFYSGHAAFSFYGAWYTSLYLQARLYRPLFSRLLLPVIQFSLFGGAAFVALTRVSDYKHHWSDVLVGSIMGSVIGVFVALYVAEVFKRREIPTEVLTTNDFGLIRMERRVDGPEVATHTVTVNNEVDGHSKDHANQRLVDQTNPSTTRSMSSSTQEARRQYFQAV